MKIKFCGGARTVTGSMHLVYAGTNKILIDAGLFQGRREDFYRINTSFPFNLPEVNAMVLSHAHIDHSGNIPTMVKKGMMAPIYATIPTVELCALMLPDSGHIQEEDIKFTNKIHKRKGLPFREPLYTEEDARASLVHLRGIDYHTPFKLADNVTCTFYEAGHVLGAAISVLDITGEKKIRLAYAVDLGRKNLPLLKDPEIIQGVDYLIIESTYGKRQHEQIENAKGRLADVINRTAERNGKIIIPSFAFERTQEIVFLLTALIRERKIKELPIYVDSPLATNITKVFMENIRFLDKQTQELIKRNKDPFGFNRIEYVNKTEDSKRLNTDTRPMIILSASGMCEAGRILHHLRNNIENPANTILVAGYMAQNTLGKRIVDRQPIVKIFGEEYRLRAEVVKINAFSAHADMNELMEYIQQCGKSLKRIFIVHGDEEQSTPFTDELNRRGYKAYLPAKGEEIPIG
ncbi:MAG: MBL fold metallo-hydrolase [Planctomycetes bacterium]|nr:MBL fold metallo-hydrolase [Planctomycetota bacterium]